MESIRPIRALIRGLDALTVLNLRESATVSEVAQEIRLPRTTVYRILETLCDAGFVMRDAADDRYRLTIMVRALSGGFDDETWVTRIAKPCIDDLCREIVWPVSIATLSGAAMLVRESTDHQSPLAIERYCAGFHVPLLTTSAGRVYLAHCPAPQREAMVETLARTHKDEDRSMPAPAELRRMLAQIKAAGYATVTRTHRLVEEIGMSVPVQLVDRVLASLTVRFAASAVPLQNGLERFLPKLRRCAAGIGELFAERQSSSHSLSDGVAAIP
jgi:IclR family mhp operon transcriptional activator